MQIKNCLESFLKYIGILNQEKLTESTNSERESREERRLKEFINFHNSYMISDNPAVHNSLYP